MSNFSRIHFHDTDIKELIYRYKQYECLWNYNSIDYKNPSLKQQAWQQIAKYFRKDVNEVKRKIKYLRSAYVGEKRKVDLSKRSGGDTVYKPSLFYYADMNFLDHIVVLRINGNDINPDLEFETTNISQDTEDNDELLSFANEEEEIDLKEPTLNCKAEEFTEPELEFPSSPKIRRSPKLLSSRSLSTQPVKRKAFGEIKYKKFSSGNVSTSEKDRKYQCKNLYTSFGKTIALQLQQMPLEVAVLTMSEIHAIITKKTLQHIKSLRSSQESWPSSDTEDSFNEIIEEEFEDSS